MEMNNKKKCFVIMPVSGTKSCTEAEWTGIFQQMIKPAVTGSRLGFDCERAKPLTGAFIKDILEGLNRADVVIADLTDRNPNVCYELGIRHTLKKRTILIAQNIDDVPSDLQSYWVVIYKKDLTGASEFKTKIRDILKEMQKDPEKSDSPVADFLRLKNIDLLSTQKAENYKKLIALVSELSENLDHIDSVFKEATNNQKLRKQKKGKGEIVISVVRFDTTCLDLLISTHYVTLSEDALQSARKIRERLKIGNARLDCWHDDAFAENIEERFIEFLPNLKTNIITFLKHVNIVRMAYINDNYQEPTEPAILLSSSEHQEYLKLTK